MHVVSVSKLVRVLFGMLLPYFSGLFAAITCIVAEPQTLLRPRVDLFIAFQSAYKNEKRRILLRQWLKPLVGPASSVKTTYRVFSDRALPDALPDENVILPKAAWLSGQCMVTSMSL